MTRKIRRSPSYEITLQISDVSFLKTPREGQRNWFLNRTLQEACEELDHMDAMSADFVPGADASLLAEDRTQALLDDRDIMEDWQVPVMARMAELVTESHGDVLEIGFGRGIGSDFIQRAGVRSHTIIECNDSVVARYEQWRRNYPKAEIRLAHGLWQDELPALGRFDGIFFHTYPLNEAEFVEHVARSSTFAEHFFSHAARHLRDGGVFSYLTVEADSLSRAHQRALLQRFSSVSLSMLNGLEIPADTRDAHWVDRMIMVAAVK